MCSLNFSLKHFLLLCMMFLLGYVLQAIVLQEEVFYYLHFWIYIKYIYIYFLAFEKEKCFRVQ